jgi:enterobactin synthetase component D
MPDGTAYAPFLSTPDLRMLPEGPLLQADFEPAALAQVALPFAIPPSLARAVPKRRAEFAAGRLLAHRAQQALGLAPRPVAIGPGRAPAWPPGLTGSITHSGGVAAVWLSDMRGLSLGLDLEQRLGGDGLRAVRQRVLNGPERDLLGADPWQATAAFSAKETLFKALFGQVGRHFGFDAARVAAAGQTRLRLALTRDLTPRLPAGAVFDIAVERQQNAVLTRLAVPIGTAPRDGKAEA